jgi:ubiquinone/menaquinone biosynthesis C-methylase UbiE
MLDEAAYQAKRYGIRENLLKYTRQAYAMIPVTDEPRILDIGCGSGIPTLELARLSGGTVTGIDIDEEGLASLRQRAEESGLSGRVEALKCDIKDMNFTKESFDIIWAEGSIFAVGFEKGLHEWQRFLKPGGFMVVHDEQGNVEDKEKIIKSNGYELLGRIILDKTTWRREYFSPIEKLVNEASDGGTPSAEVMELAQNDKRDIETFRKNPDGNSSVIFVMKYRGLS